MSSTLDQPLFGGKAGSWLLLREAGVLVPDGFVIAAGEDLGVAAVHGVMDRSFTNELSKYQDPFIKMIF